MKTSATYKVSGLALSLAVGMLLAGNATAGTVIATTAWPVGGSASGNIEGSGFSTSSAGFAVFTRLSPGGGTATETLLEDSTGTNKFLALCLEVNEYYSPGANVEWELEALKDAPKYAAGTDDIPMSTQNRHIDMAKFLNAVLPVWDSAASIGLLGNSSMLKLAVQMAVWEIANEDRVTNAYSLSSGDFRVTGAGVSGAIAQANTWLTALNAGGTSSDGLNWDNGDVSQYRGLTNPSKQDFVVKIEKIPELPVPIPAAAWLLGSGLLGLFGLARRRQKSVEG